MDKICNRHQKNVYPKGKPWDNDCPFCEIEREDLEFVRQTRPRLSKILAGRFALSICSIHHEYNKDCKLCNTHPRDVFPDWDKKVAEAEAAGKTTCKCGFEYYLTTDSCPLCGERLKQ